MQQTSVETNTCYALLTAFRLQLEEKILTIEELTDIINEQLESLKLIYASKKKPSIKNVSFRILLSGNRFPILNATNSPNTSPMLRRILMSKKIEPLRLSTMHNDYYLQMNEDKAFEIFDQVNPNSTFCLPYLTYELDKFKSKYQIVTCFTMTLYLDNDKVVDIEPYSNEKEKIELGLTS